MKKKIVSNLENEELLQPLSDEAHEIKPRSHLQKTLTKQTKRNIFIISAGIFFLILIGIIFGPRLLIEFSLLLQEEPTVTTEDEKKELLYIAPPLFDPYPRATNSAQFSVTGTAPNAEKVRLTINRTNTSLLSVNSRGEFSTTVTLTDGINQIKGKSFGPNGEESDFSEIVSVTFNNKAPDLIIDSPTDGQSFENDANPITIRGKTSGNTKITINGFQAIINSDGEFSYNFPLKGGGNEIVIIATDEAGNKTEQKINVNYSE